MQRQWALVPSFVAAGGWILGACGGDDEGEGAGGDWRRLLDLVAVAVVLVVTLAACGDSDTQSPGESPDHTTSATELTDSSVGSDHAPSSSPLTEPPAREPRATDPPVTEPPTTAPEDPEHAARAALDGWSWTGHYGAEDGLWSEITFSAVAYGGGRFVAAGGMFDEDVASGGQVWLSEEGVSWWPATASDGFDLAIDDLVHDDALGFIAIGETEDGAVVWRSADGDEWTRTEPSWPAGFNPTAVTTGPSGVVVVGNVGGPGLGLVDRIEIWGSGGRGDWVRHSVFADGRKFHIDDVTAGPDGYVAVGVQGGDQLPFILHSADGATWEDVSPQQSGFFFGATVTHATAHGYLVAFRISTPEDGTTLLQSDDGVSWRTVVVGERDATVVDVAVSGDLALTVLLGWDMDYHAAVWTVASTPEGIDLVPLPGLGSAIEGHASAAAFGEDRLVVVGFGVGDDAALAWIARPPS